MKTAEAEGRREWPPDDTRQSHTEEVTCGLRAEWDREKRLLPQRRAVEWTRLVHLKFYCNYFDFCLFVCLF